MNIEKLTAERDALRAELDKLQQQTPASTIPACEIGPCGCRGGCIETVPLYLAAGANNDK